MTKFGISQLHSPSPGEANSDWWAEEDLLVIHYTGTKNGISSSISWLESNRKFQYYKMKISKFLKSKKKLFLRSHFGNYLLRSRQFKYTGP